MPTQQPPEYELSPSLDCVSGYEDGHSNEREYTVELQLRKRGVFWTTITSFPLLRLSPLSSCSPWFACIIWRVVVVRGRWLSIIQKRLFSLEVRGGDHKVTNAS
jgi:hypothetical protein